jgi:probable HAF family extracellular repeat protein
MNPENRPVRGHAAIAVVLGFAAAAVAQPQAGFWLTGIPGGYNAGAVYGLSRDGSMAAGFTAHYTTPLLQPGFTWTREGGRNDFGLESGMPAETAVAAMSSDGSTLVGVFSGPGQLPFRRVGNGALESLGLLPNQTRGYANGVSGDGNVVVGECENGSIPQTVGRAFRWTPQGGMETLSQSVPSNFTDALAVSRDGSTIVGLADDRAFVWRQATGMQVLPGLPGAPIAGDYATAANADGSVIVGAAASAVAPGEPHAARWTSGGVQDLGVLPGYIQSHAFAISDDGSVIGGVQQLQGAGTLAACVWSSSGQATLLADYLAASGVTVPAGYRLEQIYAISGDGLTFAGQAKNLTANTWEGFVATVPAPGSVLVLLLPAIARRRRRR